MSPIAGVHTSSKSNGCRWITPRWIIDALGRFDLDPCEDIEQPWKCADIGYVSQGLWLPWYGRIWLNPPYGKGIGAWMEKMARHGCGTALIFARTDTTWFHQHVWGVASALLFIKGRIHFCDPDGRRAKHNSGGPSVLLAYGDRDADELFTAWDTDAIKGQYMRIRG